MEVQNDTNDPVNYEQSGGAGNELPEVAAVQDPTVLIVNGMNSAARCQFSPVSAPPWKVTFWRQGLHLATSDPITDPAARVTLHFSQEVGYYTTTENVASAEGQASGPKRVASA